MAFLNPGAAEPRRRSGSIVPMFTRGLWRVQRARVAPAPRLTPDDERAEIGVTRSGIDAFVRRVVEGA